MEEDATAKALELLEAARARNRHAQHLTRDSGRLIAQAIDALSEPAQSEEDTAYGYHRDRTAQAHQ
jgi:hypothetical protein